MTDREASILVSFGKLLLHRGGLRVRFSREYDRLLLPEECESSINEVWARRTAENSSIYNGSKFRLHRVSGPDESLTDRPAPTAVWDVGLTCYKDFLGTNWSPRAADFRQLGARLHGQQQAFMADPLGVGSLVLTCDGGVVLLRRSMRCAEAPGLLDIPGGHPEPEELLKKSGADSLASSSFSSEDVVNELFDSTLREIRDETNIPLSSLSEPAIMGVALNELSAGRPSCEFLVRCSLDAEAIAGLYKAGGHAEADESSALHVVPLEDVLCLDASPLWSQLAPSAKGCFLLYAAHISQRR